MSKPAVSLEPGVRIPDPAGPPGPSEPLALALLGTGLLIGWSALFYLFGALLLVWETQTRLTKEQLTLGMTAAVAASAIIAPTAGRVIDAGNGRLLLGGGALLGAAGLMLLAHTTTHIEFILAWTLIGLAQGCCLYEPSFTFLARVLRQRARKSITLVSVIGGLSTLTAYPVAAWIAEAYDWRMAVIAFGCITGAVMAPLMYFGAAALEPASVSLDRRTRDRLSRLALRNSRRQPAFWLLLLSFSLLAFMEGLVLTHAIPALVEFGQEEGAAILAMALIGPFQVAARIGILCLGVRRTALPIMVISVLAMALGTLWIAAEPGLAGMGLVFAALFGFGYGITPVLKPVVVSECLGYASIGAILGALALPYYLALAVAPYAGSALWVEGGYELAIRIAALSGLGCALVMAVCGLVHVARRAADPQPDSTAE